MRLLLQVLSQQRLRQQPKRLLMMKNWPPPLLKFKHNLEDCNRGVEEVEEEEVVEQEGVPEVDVVAVVVDEEAVAVVEEEAEVVVVVVDGVDVGDDVGDVVDVVVMVCRCTG